MSLIGLVANDNFISVNRDVIKKLGLECAVILGELCSEYTYWEKTGQLKNGMFYCTVEKLKENTSLSKYQQLQAIEKLQDIGIVSVELHGVPATRYFKIDEIQLSNFLTSDSCLKTEQLVVKKLDSSNTSNTKENTKSTNVDLEQSTTTPKRRIKLVDTPKSDTVKDTVNKPVKKKDLYGNCADMIDEFSGENINLKNKLMEFLGVRLEIKGKPFGVKTFKSYLNKLGELSDDAIEQIKIIQQSIDRQYPTFYEVKKYNYKNGKQDQSVFSEYGQVKSEMRKDEVVLNVSF